MEDLQNARRRRVLRILVGRGGCFGKEMLDACNQVGRELHEAHRQVETKPFYVLKLRISVKALSVHNLIFWKIKEKAVEKKIQSSFLQACSDIFRVAGVI